MFWLKKFFMVLVFCCSFSNAHYTATEWILKNNLRVILVNKKPSTVVYFSVWYKCGSNQDELGKSGVAHFLEHMAFEINNRKFSRMLEEIGAESNAFTSYDMICFYEIFEKSKMNEICENESERMKSIKIEDSFKSEQGAILQERNMRIDNNPDRVISEVILANLFHRRLGGIEVIGQSHEIKEITPNDLVKYHQKWFAPNNAVIVIVGDLDVEETKKIVKAYFEHIPPKELPKKNTPEVNSIGLRMASYSSTKVQNATIEFLYKVPKLSNREKQALKLALTALNLPDSKIVHTMKYVLNIASSCYFSHELNDIFAYNIVTFFIDCTSLNDMKNCEMIWKNFQPRIAKTITDKQINAVKKRHLIKHAYIKDDVSAIGMFFGPRAVKNYSLKEILDEDEGFQNITKKECCDVLGKVLSQQPVAITKKFPKGYDRE